MKNFLYQFAHKLEKIKEETQKHKDAQLKKIEALQESIIKDFDAKIKALGEKKDQIHQNITNTFKKDATGDTKGLRDLKELRQSVVTEFDKHIAKLTERRDLIRAALKDKLTLKKFKISALKTILPLQLRYLISVPFIYGMIIPAILLHIFVELYHQICFPLYKIPKVKSADYFKFDRRHLPYLNWIEKLNCAYCSYFNCLIAYVREIGARTERYWCPIKYANQLHDEHSQYELFFEYLEAEDYRKHQAELREFKEIKG